MIKETDLKLADGRTLHCYDSGDVGGLTVFWHHEPGQVTVPVLVFHGRRDRTVPSAHGAWLAARCPDAELWLRPDDGHVSVLGSCGVAALDWLVAHAFDVVTCHFGLSDIDDLDGALAGASTLLRPAGRFVFAFLHPCFPGAPGVSASWPPSARYYDEGRWTAEAELSALRRQVGAQHRMLSSYLNAFRRHGLWLDELREPVPVSQWADSRPGADRVPVYVAGRCLKVRLPADEPVSSPRCAAGTAG